MCRKVKLFSSVRNHLCTTFQCILVTTIHPSQRVSYTSFSESHWWQTILLNDTHTLHKFPAAKQTDVWNIFLVEARNTLNLNITKSFSTYTGEPHPECLYGGVSFHESSEMHHNHIDTWCGPDLQNNEQALPIYSSSGALVILFFYHQVAYVGVTLELSTTPCQAKQINLCKHVKELFTSQDQLESAFSLGDKFSPLNLVLSNVYKTNCSIFDFVIKSEKQCHLLFLPSHLLTTSSTTEMFLSQWNLESHLQTINKSHCSSDESLTLSGSPSPECYEALFPFLIGMVNYRYSAKIYVDRDLPAHFDYELTGALKGEESLFVANMLKLKEGNAFRKTTVATFGMHPNSHHMLTNKSLIKNKMNRINTVHEPQCDAPNTIVFNTPTGADVIFRARYSTASSPSRARFALWANFLGYNHQFHLQIASSSQQSDLVYLKLQPLSTCKVLVKPNNLLILCVRVNSESSKTNKQGIRFQFHTEVSTSTLRCVSHSDRHSKLNSLTDPIN